MFLPLGFLIAWLALIFGSIRLCVGIFVGSIDNIEERAALTARYLGSDSSGEAIDQSITVIAFGIVLGVLVEIGRSVSRK